MKKSFKLAQILSVVGDKLVCEMGGVYEILNYMTGDNLFTHQLPRAQKAAKPALIEQYPFLTDIDDSSVTTENWRQWLDRQIALYGEALDVIPITEWTRMDPIVELKAMTHGKDVPIIGVTDKGIIDLGKTTTASNN